MRRIAAWLAHYGDVGSLQLDPAALLHSSTRSLLVPPPPQYNPATGIVPPEYFRIPADLDGSTGANRDRFKDNSRAFNDLQGAHLWLAVYKNPTTRARYCTEAERLLIWAIFAKGNPLSGPEIHDARLHQ